MGLLSPSAFGAHDPKSRILIIERGPFFLPEHFQNLPLPYQQTLDDLSANFPWTLSARTANQPPGNIQWQHGMVPFFGGHSIMWSAWCPRPLQEEMQYWPEEVIGAAQEHFESAERLLNVVPADQIDADLDPSDVEVDGSKQAGLRPDAEGTAEEARGQPGTDTQRHAQHAGTAGGRSRDSGRMDFAKFSTPSVLLDLAKRQATLAAAGSGSPLRIVTDCVITRLHEQDGKATALGQR